MPVETRKRKAALEQEDDSAIAPSSPPPTPSEAVNKKQKKLPLRSREGGDDVAADKGTLITFDDDGKADKELPKTTAPQVQAAADITSDSDDDDEAPETVSTQKAATDVKQSALAAQKAAHEYVFAIFF